MIAETINQKIAQAMKDKDEVRLSTLRLLSSAFNYERIAKQHELSSEEELIVVRKEVKKRRDAIDSLKLAKEKLEGREAEMDQRIIREEKELAVLSEFLPQDLSDEEVEKIVDQVITQTQATTIADMGKVIGGVMGKTEGRAQGGLVAQLVKKKLS